MVPDEYDERSFCSYDSDASTTYGLSAFALLLLSQLLVMASTRCLCCEKTVAATDRLKSSTIVSFFFCWYVNGGFLLDSDLLIVLGWFQLSG